MSSVITEKRKFSELQKRKCKYCKVERLSRRQYPWAWISHVYYIGRYYYRDTQFLRNRETKNVNIVHNLEANGIEQVRIFLVLSLTGVVESVAFVRNTVGQVRNK